MKKQLKILMIVFGILLLTGCVEPPEEEEKVIDYIRVDQETVSETYSIGFFVLEDIEIYVYYMDMSYEKVRLGETLVPSSELVDIDVEGQHTIEVAYNGVTTDFTVEIVNNGLFEVVFDSNGGSEVDTVMVYFGHQLDEPEEPSLEGYTFEGWYVGENKWSFEIRHLTEDLVLSAKWSINTYQVRVMEDSETLYNIFNGEYGESIPYLAVPLKNGYTFEGWYLDNLIFDTPVSFPLLFDRDVTLYAKWTANPLRVFNWNIGGDPITLDPGLNGAMDAGDVINNTFEGLVREKNGEVLPGTADSWTVSADGLTVTFHIRDDAKWSDGSPVTADDFIDSWLRAMDPRTQSEYAWIWNYTNILGATDFVNSSTDYPTVLDAQRDAVGLESHHDGATLIIHLTNPTDWLVSLMSFYHFMPVPTGATTLGEGAWAKNPSTAISNGPFKLVEYNVGEGLVLEKNEHYWNANEVNIDVINGYFIDQATTAYSMYYAGDLDFLSSVPTVEIIGLMITSDEFYVFPLLGTYYINFNLSGCEVGGTRDVGARDNKVWCNANLRKAFSLSIDRDAITETLALGQVSAGGFIAPGFIDYNGEDFFDNARSASEIVTDDGAYSLAVTYFELAANELYPEAANTAAAVALLQYELETKSYHYNTSEGHQLIAEMMQAMWEENLGFTIQLTNEEWALFQATRVEGDFDMARGGWLTDFMDPYGMLEIFTQWNGYNDADYDSAAFEAAMAEASTATTSEDHFEALYGAYGIFMEDMPVIPIYHYNDYYLVSSRITGWSRSVLGSIDFSTASIGEAE